MFLRRTRHFASSVTLFAAVMTGCASLQQTPTIEEQNKASGDTNAGEREPPPPIKVAVDGPIAVVNQPDPKQDQRDADQRAQAQFDYWVDIGTLILLGVAAGGAIGAFLANRREADAAEEAVETAKLHMYVALRARVEFQSLKVKNFGPNQDTMFYARIRNDGHKSAFLIDHCTVPTTEPVSATPDYKAEYWRPINSPCGPSGKDTFMLLMEPMTPEAWNAINDEQGTTRLKIYGVIRYKDGFTDEIKKVGWYREYNPKFSRVEGKPTFVNRGDMPQYNYTE